MGQELRSIVLEDEEFEQAAGLYFDQQPDQQVRSGNILAVELPEGADRGGTIQLRDPLVDGQTQVAIVKEQMIDMIVAFCKDRAIPLPKSGRKAVVRRNNRTILEIELDWF